MGLGLGRVKVTVLGLGQEVRFGGQACKFSKFAFFQTSRLQFSPLQLFKVSNS